MKTVSKKRLKRNRPLCDLCNRELRIRPSNPNRGQCMSCHEVFDMSPEQGREERIVAEAEGRSLVSDDTEGELVLSLTESTFSK